MSNVATIDKIRQAIRALHNALEAKGSGEQKYNLMMGISFAPARGLTDEELIKAVEANRKISPNLAYGMQCGLKREPTMNIGQSDALKLLSGFEKELADLPQELGASMTLEFTVSNPHEQEIVETAQKTIAALSEPTKEEMQKVRQGITVAK